jgi:GNAT superfamily N-acetyltransferase
MVHAYALVPVEALDSAARNAVRRIYEDGFPARMRADFASLTDHREDSETALALVRAGEPCGFAMLRRLGNTGWTFLRYFVVDERQRGQGLGATMWDQLTAWLRTDGCTLLVFDVEHPGEPGCGRAEAHVRERRVVFYERQGARVLAVHGYQAPHGNEADDGWAPMLLMAAPVTPGVPAPGHGLAPAIVSAVYEHRWRLEPGDPRITAIQFDPVP